MRIDEGYQPFFPKDFSLEAWAAVVGVFFTLFSGRLLPPFA